MKVLHEIYFTKFAFILFSFYFLELFLLLLHIKMFRSYHIFLHTIDTCYILLWLYYTQNNKLFVFVPRFIPFKTIR